jgi:DNA-directed RNA polymerase specialized sigma24 family protein
MSESLLPVHLVDQEQLEEVFPENSSNQFSPEQLVEYDQIVALAVGGDNGAIVQLYNSPVLDQLASSVAHRIAGASNWDQAVTKDDIVQMAVCEMLSACTFITINELKRLLYKTARYNVIDIFRRQNVVKFESLEKAALCTDEVSVQAEVEKREFVNRWKTQFVLWFSSLKISDQYILKANLNEHPPRAIARLIYPEDWTKLSKEQQSHLAAKVSHRLDKLKEKLKKWIKVSEITGPSP